VKIAHHPDNSTLLSYAAGNLDEAFVTVVAAHLAICGACRSQVHKIEEIGGTMLQSLHPVAMDADALERVMSKLDGAGDHFVDNAAKAKQVGPSLPRPIARLIGDGLDNVAWKTVAPGVAVHRLATSETARGALTLLKIDSGKKIPEHGHSGAEMTLVLTGSYRDESGRFGPGDVADLDEDIEHEPRVDSSEPCICVVAAEGPTRFKGLVGRILQPLVGI